ncbi:MAG: Spermine synthase, partial [Caulobacteraceae bacterium]|nr:Spermine synthase [Caulobacteraceae bacterium]
LYTEEYFNTVKKHLNAGGVVTQWIPLYESDVATVKSEVKTFFEAFPYGAIFANLAGGQGYDVVALGSMTPIKIDMDAIQARLDTPQYAPVAQSLADVGMNSAADMFRTFTATREQLKPWMDMKDGFVNHDSDLKLQYVAGRALNVSMQDAILREMLSYRRPDSNMFVGSADKIMAVNQGFPGM